MLCDGGGYGEDVFLLLVVPSSSSPLPRYRFMVSSRAQRVSCANSTPGTTVCTNDQHYFPTENPAYVLSCALFQNADGVQYEAKLDESKLDQDEGFLAIDVRGVVRPALTNLKGAIMRRTQDLRQARVLTVGTGGITLHYVHFRFF